MDDEDEFVDAVSENSESVKINGSDEEEAEEADGGDDGFGDDDFGDFAAEEDEVDEEAHEEYDPEVEEQTQKLEDVRISQPIIHQPPPEPPKPPLVYPTHTKY